MPTWPRDSLRGLGPSREKLSPNIYLASALLEKKQKKTENRKGTRQTDEKDSKEREREEGIGKAGATRPQLEVARSNLRSKFNDLTTWRTMGTKRSL